MANEVQNEVTQTNEPAEAAPSPSNEQAFDTENKGFSFDKVIFGEGDSEGIQRGTPTAEPTVAPVQQEQAPEEYQAKNDDKRFEYWQSRASKLENQIKETKPLIDHLKQNPQVLQQPPAQQQVQAEELVEQFPEPPDKPERPPSYSREASYTDPNSESARYDSNLEVWRDDMTEYNSLKNQYDTALLREDIEKQENQRVQQVRARQQKRAHESKQNQISEDQEAYDTRVAALEIERKGITEDDIFTPGGLKRPGVEIDADIKQKQAEEDLMYQQYGKERVDYLALDWWQA